MFRSILVPLDGSAFSEHSLPPALGIAEKAKAQVHLALVHEPDDYYGEDLNDDLKQKEHEYLRGLKERVSGPLRECVHAHLLEGLVSETLEEEVKERKIDLVVMASHGRGYMARAFLGSVADRLIRHLSVPILLIHPADGAPDLSRPRLFRRVLIPLDGTALSEKILGPAQVMANLGQSEFRLLRVVVPPRHIMGPFMDKTRTADHDLLEKARQEAVAYLEKTAERLRGSGTVVQTHVVVHPQPAAAILEEANMTGCDLIAQCTHGRGGLPRLVLGSVTDKVVRGAVSAVLVHHG